MFEAAAEGAWDVSAEDGIVDGPARFGPSAVAAGPACDKSLLLTLQEIKPTTARKATGKFGLQVAFYSLGNSHCPLCVHCSIQKHLWNSAKVL